jgi:hypothetical protein
VRLSTYVNDSFAPTWTDGACILKAKEFLNPGFSFAVFDYDGSPDQNICQRYIVKVSESDFVSGAINYPAVDALTSMRFTLTRQ